MLNPRFLFILAMGMLIWSDSGLATAEYYRYKDAGGKWRYTDNLSEVPASRRSSLTRYQEMKPESEFKSEPKSESKSESGEDTGAISADKAVLNDSPVDLKKERDADPNDAENGVETERQLLQAELKSLDNRKTQLDKLYFNLTSDQNALLKQKTGLSDEAYNDKARELNKRAVAYDKQREAYLQAAENFNLRVEQLNIDQ
ncbi:MAG: hypothetical protein U9Q05_08180 [Thermodesulfobacteriota bacterium]|nr:hypothetical protein [Thermodesulfobacteriota bacterium]